MAMISNYIGKGFKRFAGIFSKFVPESIQLNRDTIIIKNNINNHIDGGEFLNKSLIGLDGSHTTSGLLDDENLREKRMITFPDKVKDKYRKIKRKLAFLDKTESLIELTKNKITNRVCLAVVKANDPIEDQSSANQLKYFDGFIVSVFDGHGGEDIAKKTKQNLHLIFDDKFKELEKQCISIEDKVRESIEYAFSKIVKFYFYLF